MGLIFISGIHGVGKTDFCKKFSKYYNFRHYSASELISRKRNRTFTRDKRVDEITLNQEALISSIDELKLEGKQFILDGHCTLINTKGEISRVPLQTFRELKPVALITLVNSVDIIQERLKARDSIYYEVDFLEEFQAEEITYAKQIAKELMVPSIEFNENKEVGHLSRLLVGVLNTH